MAEARIAVLFDAENISCEMVGTVLAALAGRGIVQIRKAVGDFSTSNLAKWMDCGREHGIELILQPNLGGGKNGADMRMAIEAMDIAHRRPVDTVALVTRDRDFSPVAERLRNAGLTVLGFAHDEPSAVFRKLCSSFEVIGKATAKPVEDSPPQPVKAAKAPPKAAKVPDFSKAELKRLGAIVQLCCGTAPVHSSILAGVLLKAEPTLHAKLRSLGKFQKRLVKLELIELVGSGKKQRVQWLAGSKAA